ncbi:MAG: prepilin-type N-terminal cleavage/methylation domain-containing protein [Nitrospinales bacterium]
MNIFRNQRGFTLLELLISITIIVVIIGLALGGMRLGISAREIGEKKVESYQRVRFIGEQIAKKIKSLDPLYYKKVTEIEFEGAQEEEEEKPKMLAFEGLPQSIRFITFADALSIHKESSKMHEVRFYLGEDPKSLKTGLIMTEQEISYENLFAETPESSPDAHYIVLAEDVTYLRFRYYKMEKLTTEEKEELEDTTQTHTGEWVDTIIVKADENSPGELLSEKETRLNYENKFKISLPRAVEMTLSLAESTVPGHEDDAEILALPPTIIPLNSGTEFARPVLEEVEEDEAS